MHRTYLLFAIATVSAFGCATGPVATNSLPELAMASLAGSSEAPIASDWVEFDPTTATVSAIQDEWSSRQRASQGGQGDRHITVMAGQRWLDEDDWGDFDDPTAYGLEFDESDPASGHGYEVGLLYTNDDDNSVFGVPGIDGETTTYEVYGGYRHTFRQGEQGVHPFVSAGVNVENGKLEGSISGLGSDSDDDTVVGAYARVGLLWDLSERVRLGLDYRHFFAGDLEVELGNVDISADADYDQAMLTLGWSF